ncbi:adenylate-forming enzyme (plasmid) [Pseudomonas sp. FeN3W]|nr:adenylate-forming enzyme [Pseudomonas sp. FeN3W]
MNKLDVLRHFLTYRYRSFASRERLLEWQSVQVSRHLQWVGKHSPFYKGMQDKPLDQWPLMNKAVMMSNFDALNTVGIRKDDAFDFALTSEQSRSFSKTLNGVAVGLSSGTSGTRGIFLASSAERALWAGAILAKLVPDMLFKSHRVALFLRAGNPLYNSVGSRRLAFGYFDLATPVEDQLGELNDLKPDIIIAPGHVLSILASLSDSISFRPRRIIACAEVLYDDTRMAIRGAFGVEVEQIYQCTEGFLACHQAGSLRFNEDMVHIEPLWLNDEKTRFQPIVTDFRRTSQPIIRYQLDDVIQVKPFDDHPFRPIASIDGRCDDVLDGTGVSDGLPKKIFPDFLVRSILFQTHVKDFRLVQISPLVLRIEADSDDYIDIKNALMSFYSCRGYVIPRFDHAPYYKDALAKLRRVVKVVK